MPTFTPLDPGHNGYTFSQADLFILESLGRAVPTTSGTSSTTFVMRDNSPGFFDTWNIQGHFTAFNAAGRATSGSVSGISVTDGAGLEFTVTDANFDVNLLFVPATSANLAAFWSAAMANADIVNGSAGADVFSAFAGPDTIRAGGGNDTIDGGTGLDISIYSGRSTEYSVSYSADGSWQIADLRQGGFDGTDRLTSVETLRFTDLDVTIGLDLPAAIEAEFKQILRASGSSPGALSAAAAVAFKLTGSPSDSSIVADIVKAAGATTSVATLAYEFFTGKIPSLGGIDYLVSPTGPNPNNLNSAYYQSFSLENRYINFAVNLGKAGEGAAAFTAKYGGLSLFEATRTAYATIFGEAPSDTKLHAILDPTTVLNGQTFTRASYFAYYGQDGANGLGTKAAMVGYLLAEAVKADVGVYAKVNDAFLTDLADGATFAVDIVGVYGKPEYVFHPG